jgi:hypothetical protein
MPEDRDQDKEAEDQDRSTRRRASSKKKQAERKKVIESGGATQDEKPAKAEPKRPSLVKKKAAPQKPAAKETEERPRRTRRRTAPAPVARRGRKERSRPEPEAMGDLAELSTPPEAEVDLMAELSPIWELGLPIGGGLCLLSVGLAVASLLTSGSQVTGIVVVGLVLLLMAIAGGGVGVLARKVWGYILGIGASGLGTVTGLLWGMYAVVQPEVSPWLPLSFFLSNLLAVLALYQMRWGPGPIADDRERFRALKRNLNNYTTAQGELAHSAAIAAVLASLMGGLLLMGANTATSQDPTMPANFTDGMRLEQFEEPPTEGTIVLARWGNEDYFFLGRVDQSRNGDEYHITFLDGDEAWVRASDLRHDAVQANSSVHIHVQGHEGWLPAQITQRANNRVEADIGPQRVWVPLAMVRVRELG